MTRTVVITKQGVPGVPGAGGYVPGGTDVAVSDGGTGASSASAARTNLGAAAASDLTATETALDTRLDTLEADTGWIMPALATDVTATAVAGRKHLGYRLYRGRVEIAMALDIVNPGAGKLLFTLPTGFRHGASLTAMGAAGVSGSALTPLRMDGDGTIKTGASVTTIMFDVTYIPGA
jgi:hypothetical protein